MSVDSVIAGANTVLKTQDGIALVYENAPEAISAFPSTLVVPQKGSLPWPRPANERMTTHDLKLTLFFNRAGDLPSADQQAKPWIDTIIDLFDQNITLQGASFNAGIVDYDYGVVEYANTSYLGVVYVLRATEIKAVAYHG